MKRTEEICGRKIPCYKVDLLDKEQITKVFKEVYIYILFFKVFGGHLCPILGPLVPLFWISGDVSSGFQSQSGLPGCLIHIVKANIMHVP